MLDAHGNPHRNNYTYIHGLFCAERGSLNAHLHIYGWPLVSKVLIAVAAFRVRGHHEAKGTAHARHVLLAHVRWNGWCLVAGVTDGVALVSRAVHAPVTHGQ